MTTATNAMADQDRAALQKRIFEHQMEAFQRLYAPTDRREAAQFQAELIGLVRQIYTDAQAPLLEHMTRLATSIATPIMFVPPTAGKTKP